MTGGERLRREDRGWSGGPAGFRPGRTVGAAAPAAAGRRSCSQSRQFSDGGLLALAAPAEVKRIGRGFYSEQESSRDGRAMPFSRRQRGGGESAGAGKAAARRRLVQRPESAGLSRSGRWARRGIGDAGPAPRAPLTLGTPPGTPAVPHGEALLGALGSGHVGRPGGRPTEGSCVAAIALRV